MKIKHRQPTAQDCGIYALANTLNEQDVLLYCNSEISIHGHRIYDLNRLLDACNFGCHIETLYKNISSSKLPAKFDLYPENPKQIAPLLMTVSYSGNGLNHMVGIHAYNDKTISILDSMKDESIVTTFSEINNIYHSVFGIFAFVSNDNSKEGYIMLA